MTNRRWLWWTLLGVAGVLLIVGINVLGFLTEPSAIGRMRTALLVAGDGSILVALVAGVVSIWKLVRRRT